MQVFSVLFPFMSLENKNNSESQPLTVSLVHINTHYQSGFFCCCVFVFQTLIVFLHKKLCVMLSRELKPLKSKLGFSTSSESSSLFSSRGFFSLPAATETVVIRKFSWSSLLVSKWVGGCRKSLQISCYSLDTNFQLYKLANIS